jgi:hypothetical protein
MTLKDSTRMSPYMLVYRKEAKMSISLELNVLAYAVNMEDIEDTPPLQKRLDQLLKFEEERSDALHKYHKCSRVLRNTLIKVQRSKLSKGRIGVTLEQRKVNVVHAHEI